MQPFMPCPVWKVPDWQRQGAESRAARAVAKRLMMPERYTKNERLALVSDGLAVEQDLASEAVYKAAWKLFRLVQRFEELVPPDCRSRPAWLAIRPQWLRVEARCGRWRFRDNQQVYDWEPYPEGRRIKRTTYDTGMPKLESD
jgi:hypothetical protein